MAKAKKKLTQGLIKEFNTIELRNISTTLLDKPVQEVWRTKPADLIKEVFLGLSDPEFKNKGITVGHIDSVIGLRPVFKTKLINIINFCNGDSDALQDTEEQSSDSDSSEEAIPANFTSEKKEVDSVFVGLVVDTLTDKKYEVPATDEDDLITSITDAIEIPVDINQVELANRVKELENEVEELKRQVRVITFKLASLSEGF